jgi:hypothetical protein
MLSFHCNEQYVTWARQWGKRRKGGARGGMGTRGGARVLGGNLIGSMGLAWREACQCAQDGITLTMGYFIVDSACCLLCVYTYVYNTVCIFFLLQVKNKQGVKAIMPLVLGLSAQ